MIESNWWLSARKHPHGLSRREWLILRMFAGGIRKAKIALALSLTYQTVGSYLKRGRQKLQKAGYKDLTSTHLAKMVDDGVF